MAMNSLTGTARQHPIAALIIGITVVGSVLDILKKLGTSVSAIEWLIQHGVRFVPPNQVQASWWFETVLLLTFACLIIAGAMYWVTQSKLTSTESESVLLKTKADEAEEMLQSLKLDSQKKDDELQKKAVELAGLQEEIARIQAALQTAGSELQKKESVRAKSLTTLDGMINAAFKIRQQLIPAAEQPINSFSLVKSKYLINKDFTTSVVTEYHMRASDHPIHFWEIEIGAEPEANPVDYLLDINFQIRDSSEHGPFELVYLPSYNNPHYKKIVIYFLPFVRPDENNPRIVTISYKWPGYFLHLAQKFEEILAFSLKAKDLIGFMEYELYLEPGTGKKLVCERQGSLAGEQKLDEAKLSMSYGSSVEWPGWKYTVKNAPQGDYSLLLKLLEA